MDKLGLGLPSCRDRCFVFKWLSLCAIFLTFSCALALCFPLAASDLRTSSFSSVILA